MNNIKRTADVGKFLIIVAVILSQPDNLFGFRLWMTAITADSRNLIGLLTTSSIVTGAILETELFGVKHFLSSWQKRPLSVLRFLPNQRAVVVKGIHAKYVSSFSLLPSINCSPSLSLRPNFASIFAGSTLCPLQSVTQKSLALIKLRL